MKKQYEKVQAILKGKRLLIILLSFIILPALIAGYTHSVVIPVSQWFTDSDQTPTNVFTAGQLSIGASNPDLFDAQFTTPVSSASFNPCAGLRYTITNTGTKRNYVRVKFEGHWIHGYHVNKAAVTVPDYNGLLDAEDSAHFRHGVYSEPNYEIGPNPNSVGFTDQILIGPVDFEPLPQKSGGSNSLYETEGQSGIGDILFNTGNGNGSVTKNGEVFKIGGGGGSSGAGWQFLDGAPPDNHLDQVKSLFGPDCLKLTGEIKGVGTYNLDDGLEIKITENADKSFNFSSNYPIYHVFVKGGVEGHNLYTYYIDEGKQSPITFGNEITIPFTDSSNNRIYSLSFDRNNLSSSGVTAGYGLQQVGVGWSHAKFLYCVPELQPGLEIVKLVSLDNGENWYTAAGSNESDYAKVIALLRDEYGYTIFNYDYSDQTTWPEANPNYDPIFLIVVVNTGDVKLIDIDVTDDSFSGLNYNFTLNPGQVWFSPQIIYTGYSEPLSTSMVNLKLANPVPPSWDPSKWYPYNSVTPVYQSLGSYFYYNSKLENNEHIPLYLNVCLNEDQIDGRFSGAVFKLYAFFEAVQYTNQMDQENWNVSIPIPND